MTNDEKQKMLDELYTDLIRTDYQAIKYAEGLITEAEYAPIKAQRQAWRDEINRLEEEMKDEINRLEEMNHDVNKV